MVIGDHAQKFFLIKKTISSIFEQINNLNHPRKYKEDTLLVNKFLGIVQVNYLCNMDLKISKYSPTC